MESRAPCACRDGVAHTAARGPSCVALDLPTLLSPKASLRRSPPLACSALPAPSALEKCSQSSAKRPFISLSMQAFLTGLVHLYNLVPYQRRAQHAGQCGVEVEGGRVPTADWMLNLQILTSGGFR